MGKTPDLRAEAEALRELVREAHGVTKDLRVAMKEAREIAPGIVKGQLDTAVTEGLAKLGRDTEEAMAASVAKVNAEFDKLLAAGRKSIPDLVQKIRREPGTVTDPRELGGNISGGGGPHDRGGFEVDSRDAVLLDQSAVGIAQDREDGGTDAIALVLSGRINGSKDRARVLHLMDEQAAAALVANIEALMRRGASDGWAERYAKAKAAEETRLREDGAWE